MPAGTYNQGVGVAARNAGAPVAGTNSVHTLTIGGTPTGGTFTLKGPWGAPLGPIAWSATNATLLANIQAVLDAQYGAGNTVAAAASLTAGIGTITITFQSNLGVMVVPTMSVLANALTGTSPTVAVAITTPGVDATNRGAPPGATLVDTTNLKLYINTGTAIAPTWTVVGTQS